MSGAHHLGEFAFGFQRIGSDGGFILAIWFTKNPENTVVWSANGNNLWQQGSTVELTAHAQLMLNDTATGKQKDC
ncbi:G-type lectin S-receptor-like serine/threonine-protein kinase LECRK3 [Prunus yedoensis var. nudiflora]|uniref:G-type lectin S-receptor-like serine/threonine-protein kinase LECRK3 n=1 Tax=Prunus yedoensis var. nudiflora TaxID=2094558 RepID=A0A314UED6_PRUYE|nr:G-type lectin S-receptor-like serine/threonine-protein kinase LECRK3 [Prunus yedoensis var. nudiflora]